MARIGQWRWITDPIRGETPLARVLWLYGIAGSFVYSALGLLIDPANESVLRIYTLGGFLYTVYVTVATYRCAARLESPFWRGLTRWSAVATLVLLPFLLYLSLSGALTLTDLGGVE
jgi:hypothetical protein